MYEVDCEDARGVTHTVGFARMPRPFPRDIFKRFPVYSPAPLDPADYRLARADHWQRAVGHRPEDRPL